MKDEYETRPFYRVGDDLSTPPADNGRNLVAGIFWLGYCSFMVALFMWGVPKLAGWLYAFISS